MRMPTSRAKLSMKARPQPERRIAGKVKMPEWVNEGRTAGRIVSNELRSRGFRVSDLNKEGTSANADLLAAKGGKAWQGA